MKMYFCEDSFTTDTPVIELGDKFSFVVSCYIFTIHVSKNVSNSSSRF